MHVGASPKTTTGDPKGRQYHAAAVLNEVMYIVGGVDVGNNALQDFYSLGSSFKWTSRSAPPIKTASPSLVAIAGQLLLYDGATSNVYSYDISNSTWSESLNNGTSTPPTRVHQTAVAFGDGIAIFGGQLTDLTYTNDVWYFSTSMYSLCIRPFLTLVGTQTWSKMYESGLSTAPFPRAGQAVVPIPGGFVVIGGGGVISTNDIWKFKLQMVPWSGLASGSPRSKHASVLVGNNMLVFGGEDAPISKILELDAINYKWISTSYSGDTPGFCYGATAIETPSGVLVHGGACSTPSESQSNTFIYTTSM